MKLYFGLPSLLLAFFLAVSPVFATRNFTIAANKSTLLGDEELAITASASGFTDGETIYIKGAFFQNGSTNYFGYTKSGDSWVKNSASNTTQRSIKIGEWDSAVVVKSDFDDSGFKGEGDYSFKIAFYYLTSGGNLSSINWSTNALTLNINAPDPTPTPIPTPTNTPMPTPTPPVLPTSTPTPVKVSTPTPIKTATPTISIATTPESMESSIDAVLGVSSVNNEKTESSASSTKTALSIKPIIIILLLVGMGLALLSLVFLWQKRNALKPPEVS